MAVVENIKNVNAMCYLNMTGLKFNKILAVQNHIWAGWKTNLEFDVFVITTDIY